MALIKTSGIITDISGKLNGSVFQRSLGGLTLRTGSTFVNRKTNSQFYSRAAIKTIQGYWSSLVASDASAWNAYATFRNKAQKRNLSLKQSGQNLFVAENTLRWKVQSWAVGLSPVVIQTPVMAMPAFPIDVVSLSYVSLLLNISLNYSLISADQFFLIKLSRPLAQQQPSQYNKLKIIPYDPADGFAQDINDGYESVWGTLPASGQYINYEVSLCYNTGNAPGYTTRGRMQVS